MIDIFKLIRNGTKFYIAYIMDVQVDLRSWQRAASRTNEVAGQSSRENFKPQIYSIVRLLAFCRLRTKYRRNATSCARKGFLDALPCGYLFIVLPKWSHMCFQRIDDMAQEWYGYSDSPFGAPRMSRVRCTVFISSSILFVAAWCSVKRVWQAHHRLQNSADRGPRIIRLTSK